MATALQHTEVDISLDFSTDADISEMPQDHEANHAQAIEHLSSEGEVQKHALEISTSDSLGVNQPAQIRGEQDQDDEEKYQEDSAIQPLVESELQNTADEFDEWDMEADAAGAAVQDASAGSEDVPTLSEEFAAGLGQDTAEDAGATVAANSGDFLDGDGFEVVADEVAAVETDLAETAGEVFHEDGTNNDFFQEIDYEDEEPAGSQGVTEEPQSHEDHEKGTTGLEQSADAGAEDSWLESNEADKAGAIDEYHRSLQDQALDEILQADSSAVSLDTPGEGEVDNDAELPEVIVSWHGVEYPMFYDSPGSEGKQCFFEDAGLLQCAMEKLLASFRSELSSDLVDTDELVLQINEMGLEFAESTNAEHYRDITLGSIMQVFNDLVRNKDPEASRPLYAYLITRPKCSSRWQSLIEDAYQGKNIDEVSIYFPMDPGTAEKEMDLSEDADESAEGEVDDMTMGEYFTADAVDEGDEAAHVDLAVEYDEMTVPTGGQPEDKLEPAQEDFVTNDDDDDTEQAGEVMPEPDQRSEAESSARSPDETEDSGVASQVAPDEEEGNEAADSVHASEAEGDGTTHGEQPDDLQDDGNSAHFLERSCYAPEVCFCASCLDMATDLSFREESNFRLQRFGLSEAARIRAAFEVDGSGATPPYEQPHSRHAHHISDLSISFSFATTADARTEAPNPTLVEAAATYDGGLEGNDNIFDLGQTTKDNELSETSGTATLDGDDHPHDFSADIDFNADLGRDLDMDVAPATGQAGELDEIDWRDYAGQDDGDDVPDVTATTAKRPRSDEDDAADAEDGQEIKRRRSEA